MVVGVGFTVAYVGATATIAPVYGIIYGTCAWLLNVTGIPQRIANTAAPLFKNACYYGVINGSIQMIMLPLVWQIQKESRVRNPNSLFLWNILTEVFFVIAQYRIAKIFNRYFKANISPLFIHSMTVVLIYAMYQRASALTPLYIWACALPLLRRIENNDQGGDEEPINVLGELNKLLNLDFSPVTDPNNHFLLLYAITSARILQEKELKAVLAEHWHGRSSDEETINSVREILLDDDLKRMIAETEQALAEGGDLLYDLLEVFLDRIELIDKEIGFEQAAKVIVDEVLKGVNPAVLEAFGQESPPVDILMLVPLFFIYTYTAGPMCTEKVPDVFTNKDTKLFIEDERTRLTILKVKGLKEKYEALDLFLFRFVKTYNPEENSEILATDTDTTFEAVREVASGELDSPLATECWKRAIRILRERDLIY